MYKITRIIVLLFALGIVLISANQAFAVNLFTDPNFDNGVNDWFTIGYPFTAINSVVRSGPYAATNTISTVTSQDYYGQIYQIIEPYASGEALYMEAYVKTNFAVGSTARAGILVEFLDSNDQPIPNTSLKTDMGGVNDWLKIYVTGNAPAGTAKVRAGAFIFATQGDNAAVGGVAYVDDLFIDKISAGGFPINPGFEDGTSGWTLNQFDVTTEVKHSGSRSATDTIEDWASQDYWGIISQEQFHSPGTAIYASCWAKTNISPLSSAKGGLIIQFINSSGDPIPNTDLKSEIGGNTDWRQLYVSGIAPSGTTKIRVGAFIWAADSDSLAVGGKIYIDDFVASTSYLPPLPPQSGLINANFENGTNDWYTIFHPNGQPIGIPFFATNSVVHSGSFAVKNTIGDTTSQVHWGEIYQEIPFSPGQTAYVTGWVKTAIGSFTAKGGLQIGFYDASNYLIGTVAKAEVGGNTDWKLLYAYKVAPAGTVKVRISGYAWAAQGQGTINGNVYLDDFNFSNTPPSALISNPGFEDALSGWTIDATGYPMVETTQEYHSGSYSAKATIQQPPTGDYWSRVYQEFDFSPGETLYSTLWAKTNINPISTAAAGLKIEFFNASSGVLLSDQDTIGGQTGWSYLYATGIAPTGTVKARVSVFVTCPNAAAASGGLAYFDDVVASRNPLPLPNFPITLSNVDFESGLNGWTDLYGPPSQIDNVGAHNGSYSLKKTIVAIPDDNYFSTIYQDIYYNNQGAPFPADQNVYLTAYLKSNINVLASANGGIMLQYFDAANVAHEIAKQQISAVNNWRQLYISGTIPAGAKRVRVSGFAFAIKDDPYAPGGTVNFDDFVYSYNVIPPPAANTYLLNTGFENGLNDWSNLYRPAFLTREYVRSGTYAAKFIIDDVQADAYRGELRQEIACAAGKIVTAKLWAKTLFSGLSLAKAGVKIAFLDSQGNPHNSITSTIGGTRDWTLLQVSATAPVGTVRVRFNCVVNAGRFDPYAEGGIAYFDNASLSIAGGQGCFLKGTKIKLSDGKQIAIEKVKIGDKVLSFEGAKLKEAAVVKTFSHPKVEGYYIISTQDGTRLNVTGVHPIFTPLEISKEHDGNKFLTGLTGKYRLVSELKKGDTIFILKNGRLVKTEITSITFKNKIADVYDLEVASVHNYFANGCLVHNKNMVNPFDEERPGIR